MKAARGILLFLALALAGISACARKRDPLKETLDRIVRAVEKRDAAGVVENLTQDYRDDEGQSRADAAASLRRYLAAYETIGVRLAGLEVERAPEGAHARFRVELSGRPRAIGGLDQILPSSSRYDFELRLVPEGDRWKVAWASWRPAS